MSLGLRADPTNTSAVISVAGTDQVVITNASNVVATTFTGALAGTSTTATALSTASGVAPSYGCRAWVNFDGTRDTSGAVSSANTDRLIRAQGNVSSVLRNGAGDYTVNFTVAMLDENYAVTHLAGIKTTNWGLHLRHNTVVPTPSAYRFFNVDPADNNVDIGFINIAVFR